MGKAAQDLSNRIRLELSKPEFMTRLWPYTTGMLDLADGRKVAAGAPGVSDLVGVVGPWGIFIGIEVKAGKDRMRESQEHFRDMVREHGGIYIVARDVLETIYDFRREVGTWLGRNGF